MKDFGWICEICLRRFSILREAHFLHFDTPSFFVTSFQKAQKRGGHSVRNTRLKNKFKKTAATYSPALHCSTIGASGLNCSVRNGKRWDTAAITAINLSAAKSIKTIRDIND